MFFLFNLYLHRCIEFHYVSVFKLAGPMYFFSVHYREFVNSVWCIKILSLQELQQRGKQGLELLNSVPVQKLSNSGCENYVGPQETRNLSPGIASVGSLDY